MKKRLALTAAILLFLCGCGAKTETHYLQTSVTHEYPGIMTMRSESTYDAAGSLVTFTQYQNGEEISRITYTHGEKEIVGEISQSGQTGTLVQKYETDEAGNILRQEMYLDGECISRNESTYDADGNVLTSTQISFPSEIISTTTYVYNEAGNPIRITYEFEGTGLVTEYTYDSNGRPSSSVTHDLLGHLTQREVYGWNEAGVELVDTYNPADIRTKSTANTYDEAGNLLTSESFDAQGNRTLLTTYTYQKIQVPVK